MPPDSRVAANTIPPSNHVNRQQTIPVLEEKRVKLWCAGSCE
jgi:hypothetical protein